MDASTTVNNDWSKVLALAITQARTFLRCQFVTDDGEDVDEEMIRKLGYSTGGVSQQCYRLKVNTFSFLLFVTCPSRMRKGIVCRFHSTAVRSGVKFIVA